MQISNLPPTLKIFIKLKNLYILMGSLFKAKGFPPKGLQSQEEKNF